MLRKLLVYAITSGLAAKLYRAWRDNRALAARRPYSRRH